MRQRGRRLLGRQQQRRTISRIAFQRIQARTGKRQPRPARGLLQELQRASAAHAEIAWVLGDPDTLRRVAIFSLQAFVDDRVGPVSGRALASHFLERSPDHEAGKKQNDADRP